MFDTENVAIILTQSHTEHHTVTAELVTSLIWIRCGTLEQLCCQCSMKKHISEIRTYILT